MIWLSIVIVAIMVCFALFGLADLTFFKNKFGVGEEFKKGIEMIGPLCLAIVGIISLVPEIAWVIERTIAPLYAKIGLDPSLAVSSILAVDMGGFQLSKAVATNEVIGKWASIVYGAMMGGAIVFTIPVGLATIQKKDVKFFSRGILFGIAAIPFGTFVSGIMMGIPVLTVLLNMIPPVIFSIIIIVCLALWPNGTTKVFKWFSVFVNVVCMLGLAFALVKDLVLTPIANTGAFAMENVYFFRLLGPTSEGIGVAGAIGLVLSGALPFIFCLNKWLKKPLQRLSEKTGLSDYGVSGFLLSLANNMAMFAIMDKMKNKEKILNTAFAVCGAFVIGDHLAFAAANAPECIPSMMVGKLISGIIAVVIAAIFSRNVTDEPEEVAEKDKELVAQGE